MTHAIVRAQIRAVTLVLSVLSIRKEDMTKELYDTLGPKEQAFMDALMTMYKEQCKTNLLLEAILKNE